MTRLLCRFSKTYNSTKRISDSFCIYSSDDFENMPAEVAKANRSGNAVVKVVGHNLPRLLDWTFAFEGEWKHSKKYGHTFYARRYELISPSTLRGIVRFLSSNAFKGIGEKSAEAIVKEFREETLDVIEKTPDLLLRVPGISIDKQSRIIEGYQKNIAYSRLCSYLAAYGIYASLSAAVYDRYGDPALDEIRNNPYILMGIRGIGFSACEKIALAEGVALDSYERIDGACRQILFSEAETGGNMFMEYERFEDKALELLNSGVNTAPVSMKRFRQFIETAVKKDRLVFRARKYIFLKEFDEAEEYIAEKVSRMLDQNNALGLRVKDLSDQVEDYCRSSDIGFTDSQKNAVIRCLMTRFSIITGGPGTGKTTILKAIIAVYKRIHPDDEITLLAPTGKASRRMSLSSGHEASTIHSKLQIYEDYQASACMIEKGLVVVDEASMVDCLLMEKLLRAISSKYNQLILIGDTSQLPSVGPGLVLKDMLASGVIPKSELTEIFRQSQGASIIENADRIKQGRSDLIYDDCFRLIRVKDESEALEKIRDVYGKAISAYGIDNVALLSPLRRTQNRFTVVSDNLNSVLQKQIVSSGAVSVSFNGTEYRIGDRVLQWRNSRESSNGDIGTITDIVQSDEGVTVKVSWENGNKTEESGESMRDISLAYAISIHKSQGSEYDCCIIPLLSDQICRLFQKNLLYTGITRSRKKVIMICDGRKALDYCISNNRETRRNTLLMQRIRFLA